MRLVESHSATTEMHPAHGAPPEFGAAIAKGLHLPLTALRASAETLRRELRARDAGQVMVRAIIDEVELLGRNVEKLLEYTNAPTPRSASCSIEEITSSVRHELAPEHRKRFVVLHAHDLGTIEVDGPMLAHTIGLLVENAFEAGGTCVQLETHCRGNHTCFTVVDDATTHFEPQEAAGPFQSTKPNRLGLGLSLVHRDLAAQGGWLELVRDPQVGTRAMVTIPNRLTAEGAA